MAKKKGMKLIANNKKAFHDYFIEDTYEAGIAPCRNRGNISAYGQMQHQGVLYPCGEWRGLYLRNAYQPL